MGDGRIKYGPSNPRLPAFFESFRKIVDKKGGVTRVSEITGISRPTVSFWYNGERTPDAENLTIISEKLDVSVDYLLGLVPESTRDEDMRTMCEYTGLTAKAIHELHGMTFLSDEQGGDSFIPLALSAIIESSALEVTKNGKLRMPEENALAAITSFLERKNRLNLTPEAYSALLKCYDGDPHKLERVVNGSLESEMLNEIGKSLNAIREQYYLNGGDNDGKR